VSYDQPDTTRDAINEALDAGFRHFTLGLPAPWPAGVARWVADEIIAKSVRADLPRQGTRQGAPAGPGHRQSTAKVPHRLA
jgi:hypothetical protein